MTTDLVPLAVLMGLATYPLRAFPLLFPEIHRMPPAARLYLRLVAPSILASLAATSVMIALAPEGHPMIHIGFELLAVGLCIATVSFRRNLLLGLFLAASSMAMLRVLGVAS